MTEQLAFSEQRRQEAALWRVQRAVQQEKEAEAALADAQAAVAPKMDMGLDDLIKQQRKEQKPKKKQPLLVLPLILGVPMIHLFNSACEIYISI